MDNIAEFTVAMPVLSFTGTSDLLLQGEQNVQVYCVQTQAVQQQMWNRLGAMGNSKDKWNNLGLFALLCWQHGTYGRLGMTGYS